VLSERLRTPFPGRNAVRRTQAHAKWPVGDQGMLVPDGASVDFIVDQARSALNYADVAERDRLLEGAAYRAAVVLDPFAGSRQFRFRHEL